MLIKQPRTAFPLLARLPGPRLDQHFDAARSRNSEQAEA
jgi:hypothetical protein